MWTRRRVILQPRRYGGAGGQGPSGAHRVYASGAAPAGAGLVVNHSDMLRAVALALLGPAGFNGSGPLATRRLIQC